MRSLLFLLFLLPLSASAQGIIKGSGILYTNGEPGSTVNRNTEAEVAIDTTTGFWWEYSNDLLDWLHAGFRIQKFPFSIAPTAAPQDKQSELLINNVDSLYRWRAGAWHHLNAGAAYTAGTGIDITGFVVTNTAPDLTVTLTNGGGITITGTYPNFTLTALDPSSTNELQTFASTSNSTSHTLTLSNSGGSLQYVEGTGIGLSSTNGLNGVLTITNSSPDQTVVLTQGTGITITGTYPNFTITNAAPDVTVTLTNGGGVAISGTYPNFTLTATDQSISNEGLLGVGAGSGTSSTLLTNTSTGNAVTINASTGLSISEVTSGNGGSITLTNSSPDQTVTLTNGGGISISGTYPNFTLTATDQSTTNELQTLANTSNSTSHTVTLSNSGGSVQYVEGTGIGLATTGTTLDGVLTVTNSAPDQTVTLTNGGGITITGTYPNFTLTASGGGITSLNGLTAATQTFATGTSGTDFAISSVTSTHTFNLPVASATNTGKLSAADWVIFNAKVGGSGTTGYLPKWATSSTLTDSKYFETSNTVSLGTNTGIDAFTRLYIYGGTSGANVDARGINGAATDQAVFEVQGSDYSTNFRSMWIKISGVSATGTTDGISNVNRAELAFQDPANAIIRSITNIPIQMFINGGQMARFTSSAFEVRTGKDLRIHDSDNTNYVAFKTLATGSLTADYTLTLPADDGTSGQYLQTDGAGILSWATASGAAADLTFSGASSPVTLNSSSGTDVIFTAGTSISFSQASNNLTINNTAPDLTVTLTNGGGVAISGTYPNFTLTATDQSISNEGILGVGAGGGTSSTITTNTSTGNAVTINVSTGLSIAESTSANGGSITLTNSSPDQTVTLTNGGGVSISGTYPNFTLTATDQSTTNELQTLANTSNSTSHTVTLSNSGGSLQYVEGTGIGMATTGTGLDGVLTVTNTAPDQTVTLTNGGGISISGTYPNFTLTASVTTAYSTLQEEGSGLTQRSTLNFVGSTATASDNGSISLLTFDSDVNALASTSTTGIYVLTAAGTSTTRTITAGTGITVNNGSGVSANPEIVNSAPDQTVVLTNGTGISITGTYPNFTINATVGATAYSTIQEEGSSLTQRSILNFVGSAFTASDNTTKTDVTADSDLNALASNAGTGLYVITGAGTSTTRSIAVGSSTPSPGFVLSLANASGTGGNPTITLESGGFTYKQACRAISTSNITLSGTQTIDGVALAVNDRCLVAGQSTGANNGIYVVGSGAWSRDADANVAAYFHSGQMVFIEEGTAQGESQWVLTTDGVITVGTTALTYKRIGRANQATAATYGSATQVPVFVLNDDGTISSVTNTTITTAGTDLSYTGTGGNYTLNSSTGTDVDLNSGTGILINRAGSVLTFTALDSDPGNEIQTISASGAGPTSYNIDLNLSGGSVTLAEGANVDLTRSGNTITIASSAASLTEGQGIDITSSVVNLGAPDSTTSAVTSKRYINMTDDASFLQFSTSRELFDDGSHTNPVLRFINQQSGTATEGAAIAFIEKNGTTVLSESYIFNSISGINLQSSKDWYSFASGKATIQADSVIMITVPSQAKIPAVVGITDGGTLKKIKGTNNGDRLSWNSGGWVVAAGGAPGITGTGSANHGAYWTSATNLSFDADFQFDATNFGFGGAPIGGIRVYSNGNDRTDGSILSRGTGTPVSGGTAAFKAQNTTGGTGDTWYFGSLNNGTGVIQSGNASTVVSFQTDGTVETIYDLQVDFLNGTPTKVTGVDATGLVGQVTLGTDVTLSAGELPLWNSNDAGSITSLTTTALADVTGLSFAVTANKEYEFRAVIKYSAAATTTGSAFSINGPAGTVQLHVMSGTSNVGAFDHWQNAVNTLSASPSSAYTSGNIAIITGIVEPTASGTYIIRGATEVAASAITVQGVSNINWREIK